MNIEHENLKKKIHQLYNGAYLIAVIRKHQIVMNNTVYREVNQMWIKKRRDKKYMQKLSDNKTRETVHTTKS